MIRFKDDTTTSKQMWTALALLPVVGLTLGGLVSCASDQQQQLEEAEYAIPVPDGSYVAMYAQDAIDNAIVREHAVYTHHFRLNGAQLNTLGRRVIETLAQNYGEFGGALSIVQGDVTDEIFEARIGTVRDAIADAGVDPSRITIGDTAPGGDGMRSTTVLSILDIGTGAVSTQQPTTPPIG